MAGAYLTYIRLCFFRSSVRNASASTATLVLVCVLFAVTSILRFEFSPEANDPVNYYSRILVVFVVFNVLMYLTLVFKKSQNRYRKVLSTFIGTRTLIDLFMILILLVSPADEQLRMVLFAVVAIWRMCIVGYILKDALNVLLPTGILISVAFTIISIEVANMSVGFPVLPEEVPTSE
ncbi:MAG: hypothetical protein F4227_00435 [Gammaproteobacteria bacterium]|nr:hypothetical protein [Gammaproteobacteria bacterium]MYF01480.1 hypothetical protein [Gammaproteobacteria bacterium]MYI77944.1 hypothetical protein [Gammaproteobacteria bacterium]